MPPQPDNTTRKMVTGGQAARPCAVGTPPFPHMMHTGSDSPSQAEWAPGGYGLEIHRVTRISNMAHIFTNSNHNLEH